MAIRNGNRGSNFLFGTFGNDVINGRGGNDFLFGWFGNDILRGGNGNDWMFGGFGSDRLFGGNGDDIGFGGSGNDRLVGGRGSDQMYGGSGNDTFVYRAERNVGEVDYYAGGSGNDRLVLRLNADEAADTDIQADISAFEAFIAAGGGGNFTFGSLGLTVNSIESLTVRAPDPVEPTNTAPVVSGAVTLMASDENAVRSISFSDLLAGASDADNDDLSVSNIIVTSGNAIFADGDGGIDVTPDTDDESEVRLSYTISDGNGGSVEQTASFDLLPVNNAPILTGALNLGPFDEDTSLFVSTQELFANVADEDDDTPSISAAGVSVTAGDATVVEEDGGYRITPAADFNTDPGFVNLTLSYTVEDGNGGSVENTANVNVTGVQDAPTVQPGFLTVTESGSVTFQPGLFANDVDGDALEYTVTANGNTIGDVSFDGFTGIATYTPGSGFEDLEDGQTRSDTFVFTATDFIDTVQSTVTVTVEGESMPNSAPMAVNDPEPFGDLPPIFQAIDQFGDFIDVLENDTDPDGDLLSIVSIGLPGQDAIMFGAEGTEVTIAGVAVERVNGELGQALFFRALDSTDRLVELEYTISDGSLTDTAIVAFGVMSGIDVAT